MQNVAAFATFDSFDDSVPICPWFEHVHGFIHRWLFSDVPLLQKPADD